MNIIKHKGIGGSHLRAEQRLKPSSGQLLWVGQRARLGNLQQVNGGIRHLTQGPLQVLEERDRVSISVIDAVPDSML
jgi:hypothetical protein